jgi:hypothetical protein
MDGVVWSSLGRHDISLETRRKEGREIIKDFSRRLLTDLMLAFAPATAVLMLNNVNGLE